MRQWLIKAGLFEGKSKILWDVYYDLTGIEKNLMDSHKLDPGQKYFYCPCYNFK